MRPMYKIQNRYPSILTKKFYKNKNVNKITLPRTTNLNTRNKNTVNKLKHTFKSPTIKTKSKNKRTLWTFLGFKPLAKK